MEALKTLDEIETLNFKSAHMYLRHILARSMDNVNQNAR